jgi:competence ComEA-like helix-hairpin-helix protein
MNPRFREAFYFTKEEKKGILALVIMMAIVFFAREILIYFNPVFEVDTARLRQVREQIQQELIKKEQAERVARTVSSDSRSTRQFNFDPNGLALEKWQELGLSPQQAQVIKNYEAKGGVFRIKTDVRKMFVISDQLYERLEPYILLPDSLVWKRHKKSMPLVKVKKKIVPIDINQADTNDFKKLKGIGAVLSRRIVKYRERLGGFYNKAQLKEVYGLAEEIIDSQKEQLFLSKEAGLSKINVNTASVEELKAHPYINWKVANSMVKYREQHGPYKNLEAIQKSHLIGDTLFSKIRHYLEK